MQRKEAFRERELRLATKRDHIPKPDDRDQSKAFIEKAREIGADEEHSAADELMKRLAEKKPEPRTKSK